jgi:type IV fimbrial biogenesis protein FimT
MTLIELLVAMAVVVILLVAVSGNFGAWLANVQIRTATESMQNGLQLARAEAIRRNRSVMFWLTSAGAAPGPADWVVACAVPSGTGARPEAPGDCPGTHTTAGVPPPGPPYNYIQMQTAAAQQTGMPQIVTAPAGASVVTFNSLGMVASNADGSAPLTQIDTSLPAMAASRTLRITIAGGQIRMCDPALTGSGDPRGC